MKKISLFTIIFCLFIIASGLFVTSTNAIEKAPLTLDNIAINNEQVEVKNGEVNVSLRDSVKIAGIANPNQEVTVSFASEKYKSTSDNNGNWFVLFSILNLSDGKYSVEAKLNGSETPYPLITMVVGKGGNTIVKTNQEKFNPNQTPSASSSLSLFIFIPISVILGWFLGSFYEKSKK